MSKASAAQHAVASAEPPARRRDPAFDMFTALQRSFERSGRTMPQLGRTPDLEAPDPEAPDLEESGSERSFSHRIARLVRRFEETLDHISVGVAMVDSGGRMQVCNEAAIVMLGLPRDLIRRRPRFNDVIAWQIRSGEFSRDEILAKGWVSGAGIEDTAPYFRRVRPTGQVIDVRTVRLADGAFVRTFTDQTDDVRHQTKLAAAEAEHRSLFENATFGIYRSTLDGRQLRANRALVQINGYASEAQMLANVNDIAKEWYVDPARRREFSRLMARDGRVTDFVSQIRRHKTGEPIWISETAWMVTDADGQAFYEGTVIEATERIEAERRIAHLALHDQVTGLANRRGLIERTREALAAGAAAALLIDLDGFKAVNDTYGHAVGDQLLQQVAERLRHAARFDDFVARFGGDEFVILRTEAQAMNPALVAVAAGEIIQNLRRAFRIGDRTIWIGASVGVAITSGGTRGIGPEELMREADLALYKAKAEGRQTYRFFDADMMSDVQRRLDIERELRAVVAGGGLEIHYQPIVALPSRRPVAYEALARWRHPRLGVVSPAEFVPVAESAGIITSLGEWILRTAFRAVAALPPDMKMSINVSPLQLHDKGFVREFEALVAGWKVEPSRLIIEITESVFMAHNATVLDTLAALRSMGVAIALDDFGTGFSALGYLQRFRFDRIKLDQAFLRDAGPGTTNDAITRAILQLGLDLEIPIIAEGIESEEQLELLVAHGCPYAQGYLFGRPQPLSAVAG